MKKECLPSPLERRQKVHAWACDCKIGGNSKIGAQ